MIVPIVALIVGATLLILFAGYCYGRWETAAHYEPLIDELEQTIFELLPSGVKVIE